MLTYTFSAREKTLILVFALIVVFVAWFGLVYQGTTNEIARMDGEIATTNQTIESERARVAQKANMQAVIAQHQAAGTAMTDIPQFDNIKPLMTELDGIMRDTIKYNLSFDALNTTETNYILRGVGMNFNCESYDRAEQVIRAIANGKYPCIIDSIAMTGTSSNRLTLMQVVEGTGTDRPEDIQVGVTVHVTFFEKPNAEQIAEGDQQSK